MSERVVRGWDGQGLAPGVCRGDVLCGDAATPSCESLVSFVFVSFVTFGATLEPGFSGMIF
jgi:hypothetical protein